MTMILGNWSTGSLSVFSESLYLIKGNEISKENPGAKSAKTPPTSLLGAFLRIRSSSP